MISLWISLGFLLRGISACATYEASTNGLGSTMSSTGAPTRNRKNMRGDASVRKRMKRARNKVTGLA